MSHFLSRNFKLKQNLNERITKNWGGWHDHLFIQFKWLDLIWRNCPLLLWRHTIVRFLLFFVAFWFVWVVKFEASVLWKKEGLAHEMFQFLLKGFHSRLIIDDLLQIACFFLGLNLAQLSLKIDAICSRTWPWRYVFLLFL